MRNLTLRVIVWFVGVPAVVAIVLLLPYMNHLALNLVVVVVCAIGAVELASLFERKDARYRASSVVIPLLGATIPLSHLLSLTLELPEHLPYTVLVGAIGMILFVQVFRHTADDFQHTLTNISANITVLIYPGLFLSYLVRMSEFEHASILILVFLVSVFFNDSAAYVFGMLYRLIQQSLARRHGKEWEPRFVFPVSPKKTVVGFVAGFLFAVGVLVSSRALFPQALTMDWGQTILTGAAVGLATIIGDLIESAIKRSATSKDSGEIIPGRGGILDSVDSILYAAPVFYYLLRYLA